MLIKMTTASHFTPLTQVILPSNLMEGFQTIIKMKMIHFKTHMLELKATIKSKIFKFKHSIEGHMIFRNKMEQETTLQETTWGQMRSRKVSKEPKMTAIKAMNMK